MDPADAVGHLVQLQDGEQIEGDDIEDFDRLVGPRRRKAPPIVTDTDAPNLATVGPEFLDGLDAHRGFLPELDDAITRARDEEIRAGRHGHEGELLLVHQRFGIARARWQCGHVQLFVWKLPFLLLGCGV